MISRECKRLAEVDFPITAVSHQVVERRAGHPFSIHHWWARRPLASCRAMLMAILLPDPCDPNCPSSFKRDAKVALAQLRPHIRNDEELRAALLWFIGTFSNLERASKQPFLEVSRQLIRAAHGEVPPLVVDPFAGGGSIPIEALRIGCEVFSSDLNPVAALIEKVLIEDIPRDGRGLADELKNVISQLKENLASELASIYTPENAGSLPVAYIWARTVRCESPSCGAEIPLMRSFWLSNKGNRKVALRPVIGQSPKGAPTLEFEIFEPKNEASVRPPSVAGAKATCLRCSSVLTRDRVRTQLISQRGGADVIFDSSSARVGGARLVAVATVRKGMTERVYRLATRADYDRVRLAQERLGQLSVSSDPTIINPLPDEPIVQDRVSRNSPFRMHLYGCTTFADLFSARQKLSLIILQQNIQSLEMSDAARRALCLAMGDCIRHWNAFSKWHRGSETVAGTFALQAISMAWDFPELHPMSSYAGGIHDAFEGVFKVVETMSGLLPNRGQVQVADAAQHPMPSASAACWFTDPPYYDAIPYSDLSDVFYVWHKRTLPSEPTLRQTFASRSGLAPKQQEIVQDDNREFEGRPKNREFFETAIAKAFGEGKRELLSEGIGCVVFAHSSTEGWEAFLEGLLRAGWTVTSSWPIATERGARLRARDSAALETSVHLICRPRNESADIGEWSNVLRELPTRVGDWMQRLQLEGIRGADLVFACIGPALEIFTRYSRVEQPDGSEVRLPQYLEKVWEVVGRAALEQILGTAEAQARNGGLGALEEDARLTALFLWTLRSSSGVGSQDTEDEEDELVEEAENEQDDEIAASKKSKGLTLAYDIVRRFAQPLGIHLEVWDGRIIQKEKGVVRLLPVTERALQLFGEAGADAVASAIEGDPRKAAQLELFPSKETDAPKIKARGRKNAASSTASAYAGQVTTLDRVHAAILLQRQGRTNALRTLLAAEAERGSDFSRLANALSALYPAASEEKRLLDAMLLAIPRR